MFIQQTGITGAATIMFITGAATIMFIQQTGITAIIATSILNLITYVIIIAITQNYIMDIEQIDYT